MNGSRLCLVLCIIGMVSMLNAYDITSGDLPTGTVVESSLPQIVEIPADFDAAVAKAELKEARLRGDTERAAELSFQLNTWLAVSSSQTVTWEPPTTVKQLGKAFLATLIISRAGL